ncbi:MAG: FecR domain-containing protein [Myxococcota bacterium]
MRAFQSACLDDEAIHESLEPGATVPPHVRSCANCRARRASLARAIEVARGLPVLEPSPEVLERGRAGVLGQLGPGAPVSVRPRRWALWGLAAAAALLIVLLGTLRSPGKADAPVARAAVRLLEESQFEHEVTQAAQGTLQEEVVRLHQGQLELKVAKLSSEERFRVVSGDAEVEVRGTAFQVAVNQDRLKSVRVLEGVVVVRVRGEPAVWLERGGSWSAPAEAPPPESGEVETRSPPPHAFPDAPRSAQGRSAPPKLERPALPPPAAPGPAPLSAEDASIAPEDAAPPPDETPPIPPDAGALPVASAAPIAAPPPVVDLDRAEQEFKTGWSLLRGGRPEQAVPHLEAAQRLAGDDGLAEDAGYWFAMALDSAKQPATAALQSFLERYPNSSRWDAVALLLAQHHLEDGHAERAKELLLRLQAKSRDAASKKRAEELLRKLPSPAPHAMPAP